MSTIANILMGDRFLKLPTSTTHPESETGSRDIYPETANIYLCSFQFHYLLSPLLSTV